MRQKAYSHSGISFFEIIAVLVILSFLAAMAIMSYKTDPTTIITETDKLASTLRFAQVNAMKDIQYWEVTLTQNSVSLGRSSDLDDASPSPANIPGMSSSSYTLNGVTISGGTGVISFDERGRPYLGTSILTSSHTITVHSDDSEVQDRIITINALTGFIQ